MQSDAIANATFCRTEIKVGDRPRMYNRSKNGIGHIRADEYKISPARTGDYMGRMVAMQGMDGMT